MTEFKLKTPEFVQQLKDTGEPIVLTINGKAELVVQDAASYQKLLDVAEQAGVIEGIRQGLADVQAGRTQPVAEAFAEIRRELNLPAGWSLYILDELKPGAPRRVAPADTRPAPKNQRIEIDLGFILVPTVLRGNAVPDAPRRPASERRGRGK